VQDALGDAPEGDVIEAGAAVGADDEQIGPPLGGVAGDLGVRRAFEELRRAGLPSGAQALGEGLELLLRGFTQPGGLVAEGKGAVAEEEIGQMQHVDQAQRRLEALAVAQGVIQGQRRGGGEIGGEQDAADLDGHAGIVFLVRRGEQGP
jgi:hypothetical protein